MALDLQPLTLRASLQQITEQVDVDGPHRHHITESPSDLQRQAPDGLIADLLVRLLPGSQDVAAIDAGCTSRALQYVGNSASAKGDFPSQ